MSSGSFYQNKSLLSPVTIVKPLCPIFHRERTGRERDVISLFQLVYNSDLPPRNHPLGTAMTGWSYYLVATTLGATVLGVILAGISIIDVCRDIRDFEQEVNGQLATFKVSQSETYFYEGKIEFVAML